MDIKNVSGDEPDQDQNTNAVTKKILLIIEDETPLAEALSDRFGQEGYNVLKAEDGQKGLEMAIEYNPNAILLDLHMPVMDGTTMLHKLRQIPKFKYVPVIILTNDGDIDNIRETQVYDNAIEFLIKSNVSLEEIVNRVRPYLH